MSVPSSLTRPERPLQEQGDCPRCPRRIAPSIAARTHAASARSCSTSTSGPSSLVSASSPGKAACKTLRYSAVEGARSSRATSTDRGGLRFGRSSAMNRQPARSTDHRPPSLAIEQRQVEPLAVPDSHPTDGCVSCVPAGTNANLRLCCRFRRVRCSVQSRRHGDATAGVGLSRYPLALAHGTQRAA
jgi:hypothetical protein